ncbi:hypothetical protein [Streptomyces sp. MMG1533]|nr:hypothetical protein [Streptomyces sp. MMG1533]
MRDAQWTILTSVGPGLGWQYRYAATPPRTGRWGHAELALEQRADLVPVY